MNDYSLSRRNFVKRSALFSGGLYMAPQLASAFDGGKISVQSPVDLSWLEDPKNTRFGGVTLGVPWPKGQLKKSEFFMADRKSVV